MTMSLLLTLLLAGTTEAFPVKVQRSGLSPVRLESTLVKNHVRVRFGLAPVARVSTVRQTALLTSAMDSDYSEEDDENIPSFFASPDPFSKYPYGVPTNPEQEAADLKAALTEVINDAVAAGIDDISNLRAEMKQDLEQQRRERIEESERRAQAQSQALLSKIDRLTSNFMQTTEVSRQTTRLAAAADRSMEGKGLQGGVWGTLGGVGVLMMNDEGSEALLGSVQAATKQQLDKTINDNNNPRILVVADASADEYAKKVLPLFKDAVEDALPNVQIEQYNPTTAVPIGGNDAQCVVWFATSLTDPSSIPKALDRLMQKTLKSGGGSVTQPPSQFVVVSTIGTQRTNQMPFSMQNMFGGKLEKRRQVEESLVAWLRNYVRDNAVDNGNANGMVGLDYTICKLGELKADTTGALQMSAGDALEGTVDPASAANVLLQAIAYQPSARNTTFSVVGSLPVSDDDESVQDLLDDAFLRLDGPELLRIELPNVDPQSRYEQLAEYVREWAELLALSGKGLTTPIRYQAVSAQLHRGIAQQQACQLVFVATATGKNYLSKEEEREQEAKGAKSATLPATRLAREGGIEFVIEVTNDNSVRVRAKRCNYAQDAAIKELSESTILSRFKESIEVWKRDHQ